MNLISYSLYSKFQIRPETIDDIALQTIKELLSIKNWNMLWFLFILSIPLIISNKKMWYEVIAVGLVMASYLFFITGGPHDPVIHVSNTMNRLLLHIVPIVVYILPTTLYDFIYRKNE